MKKILAILAVALAAALAFTSCKKDDVASNTLTIRGAKLNVSTAIYAIVQDEGQGFVNFDIDAGPEATQLHGYGGFPAEYIGKTTPLEGDFFLSFNPMSGPSIDPVIQSGTVTVTQVSGGKIHVKVDAVETNGEKFIMDCVAYDETQIDDWEHFQYK